MKASIAISTLLSFAVQTSATCYDYLIIDTRGTFEPQGESIGFRDMISNVMAKIPKGSRYDTVYPAISDLQQTTTVEASVTVAEQIEDGISQCPEQKYALLGYSQGATVTNLVLQKFSPDSEAGQLIEAVVLVGNPYHLPNKSESKLCHRWTSADIDPEGNVDENCGQTTVGASGVLLPIANYSIPDAWYQTGKVLDICFSIDPVCNGVNLGSLLSPTHLLYGFAPSVQQCGAKFLISALS